MGWATTWYHSWPIHVKGAAATEPVARANCEFQKTLVVQGVAVPGVCMLPTHASAFHCGNVVTRCVGLEPHSFCSQRLVSIVLEYFVDFCVGLGHQWEEQVGV
eukprot:1062819-Amphidinium_carterae.1